MRHPQLLFASTYPPTACGLATFTRALVESVASVRQSSEGLGVARVHSAMDTTISLDPLVVGETCVDSSTWPEEVSRLARHYEVLWIQHEFGIFGPDDGRRVLDLCEAVPVPVVTTMHTVLSNPTPGQGSIVEALARRSEKLVVMSHAAQQMLVQTTRVDPHKVAVIPHGAHCHPRLVTRNRHTRPTIVTWGLVGPGKGIEWGIRAMDRLRDLRPLPRYVVQGATHPNVLRAQGEAYRNSLFALVDDLDVAHMVDIDERYLAPAQLADLIGKADLALLPYDSTEQVTSGVLVEAIGAGLPVVATAFPHAVEMLADGAGRTVPHRDPLAIANALENYLTRPQALRASAWAARRSAPELSWSSVARQCEALAGRVVDAAATAGVA